MSRTEFKLTVTVWSLEDLDGRPCAELQSICRLLDAPALSVSPADMYPSKTPLFSGAANDSECGLEIVLSADPSDQMGVAEITIRCPELVADNIEACLRRIRDRSEVQGAMLRGNLGVAFSRNPT